MDSVVVIIVLIVCLILLAVLGVVVYLIFKKKIAPPGPAPGPSNAPTAVDFLMVSPTMINDGTYTFKNVGTGKILSFTPAGDKTVVTSWNTSSTGVSVTISPTDSPSLYLSVLENSVVIDTTSTQWQVVPFFSGFIGVSLISPKGILCDSLDGNLSVQPTVVDNTCAWEISPSA